MGDHRLFKTNLEFGLLREFPSRTYISATYCVDKKMYDDNT